MKIGIFGGSFDPIHIGHIHLAEYALEHSDLDQLWLMVSPRNPLKPQGPIASDSQRLEMARLAVSNVPGIEVSDFEFNLPIPSYTYLTLSQLQKAYPEHQFSLLIGGDNWANFRQWRFPDEIIRNFGLIVYPRPGETIPDPTEGVTILQGAPQMPVSSTAIRSLLQETSSSSSGNNSLLGKLLPIPVLDYIRNNQLYYS